MHKHMLMFMLIDKLTYRVTLHCLTILSYQIRTISIINVNVSNYNNSNDDSKERDKGIKL